MGTHKTVNHNKSVVKRSKHDRGIITTMNTNDYTIVASGGTTIKRFRNPHEHDVLSGRGGSINNHPGNIRYRAWVAERKKDYVLAKNKTLKGTVTREVIDMVLTQTPPGRFLQREPHSDFWIEVAESKVFSKTAQALREGAPRLKAAVGAGIYHLKENDEPPIKRARSQSAFPTSTLVKRTIGYVEPEESLPADFKARAMAEMEANISSDVYNEPRQVPFDYDSTPPLTPVKSPVKDVLETLILEPAPLVMRAGLKRVHSLAFSDDMSMADIPLDFVNPFNDEEEYKELPAQVPLVERPGLASRRSSTASDMGGIGALLSAYDNISPRSVNSSESFSDLPDALPHHVQDSDFSVGVRSIYDALHGDDGEELALPTSPIQRRLGGSALTTRLLGRVGQ